MLLKWVDFDVRKLGFCILKVIAFGLGVGTIAGICFFSRGLKEVRAEGMQAREEAKLIRETREAAEHAKYPYERDCRLLALELQL